MGEKLLIRSSRLTRCQVPKTEIQNHYEQNGLDVQLGNVGES